MRLLVAARAWPPDVRSGRSEAFARLCARLAETCEVDAVVGYHRDRGSVPAEALGVDLRGATPFTSTVAMWRAMRERARDRRPDVVLTAGLEFLPTGWPTVAVVRDRVGTGWVRPASGPLVRAAARGARALVVPTPGVRADLRALGVDPWRVEVIPEEVELPPEAPPLPPAEPLVLLVPGTIHPAKGQHLAIDAVSRLPAALKDRVRLVIAGAEGDERYVSQLRIAARGQPVELRVGADAVGDAIDRCRMLVYPTALDEGFPDAALRAMARGRGVLVADRGPVRDAIGAGAVPVIPNDPADLRDRIAEVLAGRIDPAELGRLARDGVRRRFAWELLWPRWRMVLAAATRRRGLRR